MWPCVHFLVLFLGWLLLDPTFFSRLTPLFNIFSSLVSPFVFINFFIFLLVILYPKIQPSLWKKNFMGRERKRDHPWNMWERERDHPWNMRGPRHSDVCGGSSCTLEEKGAKIWWNKAWCERKWQSIRRGEDEPMILNMRGGAMALGNGVLPFLRTSHFGWFWPFNTIPFHPQLHSFILSLTNFFRSFPFPFLFIKYKIFLSSSGHTSS